MNIELVKSLVLKGLPVLVTYLIGKGILDQTAAEHIPGAAEALIVLIVAIPTILRSIKKYKAKPEVK